MDKRFEENRKIYCDDKSTEAINMVSTEEKEK
jgi:hypothetical protein